MKWHHMEQPPPSTNSVHDLSKSDYNYNVESIGAKLYTDKRFKNASSIFVYVNDFAHEGGSTDIPSGTARKLTITLYDSNKKQVSSKSLSFTESNPDGSVSFKSLDKNKQYYVQFTVPNNGIRWSFYGSVSGN